MLKVVDVAKRLNCSVAVHVAALQMHAADGTLAVITLDVVQEDGRGDEADAKHFLGFTSGGHDEHLVVTMTRG